MRKRLHTLKVAYSVPGFVLRAGIGLAALAVALVFEVTTFWQILLMSTAVLAMIFPRTMAAWLTIALIALGMFFSDESLLNTMLAVLVAHLIHVFSALALIVPARSQVQLRALAPTLKRFVVVQLAAQTILVFLSLLVPVMEVSWLAPLGALALLGLLVILIRPLREDSGPT